MIILFSGDGGSGPTPPDLPNLHIQDAETLVNTPVAGNDGWESDFLQAQTLCYVPMSFGTPETGKVALDESEAYWSRRQSKALLRINFSNSGANTVIRPLYTDDSDVVSVGDSVTITATARQDGGAYMAPVEVFEVYGANKIAFVIESISVGTLDLSVAGV
jgi:hypothetical protein